MAGKWTTTSVFRLGEIPLGVAGVYVIYDESDVPFYVGSSLCLHSRIRSHVRPRGIYKVDERRLRVCHRAAYIKWRKSSKRGEHLMGEFRLIVRLRPDENRMHANHARKAVR